MLKQTNLASWDTKKKCVKIDKVFINMETKKIEQLPVNEIIQGDSLEVLKTLPSDSVDMCISSPPYYALRDYGVEGQIGLEPTIEIWLDKLIAIYDEVKRVLKPTGTCWVNLGDTYSSNSKGSGGTGEMGDHAYARLAQRANFNTTKVAMPTREKSLMMAPQRFAIRMCDQGWILRNEILWHKLNPLPESAKDRFTRDFEYLYFFTKEPKYYFKMQFEKFVSNGVPATAFRSGSEQYLNDNSFRNSEKYINNNSLDNSTKKRGFKTKDNKIGQDSQHHGQDINYYPEGRNKRCVWSIPVQPFGENHAATFPEELIKTPILAGCPEDGIVLDIFMGAATTALVALKLRRKFLGIELNPSYIEIANKRIEGELLQTKLKI